MGGGLDNQATASFATIAGGGRSDVVDPTTANLVSDNYGTVGGGGHNQAGDGADGDPTDADYATVGGGLQNTASGPWSTVGGGEGNTASDWEATVGGGYDNTADSYSSTVAGGDSNTASGHSATVAGGGSNYATGSGSAIGGGDFNDASGDYATIGGGCFNDGSAYATVGGGTNNWAGGTSSMVPGGRWNSATGNYSFAAGTRAKATHTGAFLWADSNDKDFTSTANDSFGVRSTGGARFVLAIDGSGLPTWTCSVSNGGSWSCSSDRNLKRDLLQADGRQVLEVLAQMPVYYWTAVGDDTRHIGPMAQDFAASFAVGESDTAIDTIDLDGVALAAIQGLYATNQEQASRIEALETENAAQQEQIDYLAARLTALEAGEEGPTSASPAPLLFGLLPLAGVSLAAVGLVYQKRKGGGR